LSSAADTSAVARVAMVASTRPPYLSMPTREMVTPPSLRIFSSAARAACACSSSLAQRACSSAASMPRSQSEIGD
jgi:hypothetical protein